MTHLEAKQAMAVEKYLLGEMTAAQREEFEAHLFDCEECAADLKATAAFLDAAKDEFKRGGLPKTSRPERLRPVLDVLFRPAFLSGAFACLLLVVLYQNILVLPKLKGQVDRLQSPEILAAITLIGANSRAGTTPARAVVDGEALLLSFDVPPDGGYDAYSAQLLGPSGGILWSKPISAAQAQDTVSLRIPGQRWEAGEYTLILQGSAPSATAAVPLSRLRFVLSNAIGTEHNNQQ
jgi:hypothetical protein